MLIMDMIGMETNTIDNGDEAILRVNCIECKHYIFKINERSKIGLLIVTCPNRRCRVTNYYRMENGQILFKPYTRQENEPDGVLSTDEMDQWFFGAEQSN